MAEIKYKNGDVYNGDVCSGIKHGKGRMVYANGYVYEGGWIDNQRQGKGTLTYTNGDVYEGEWKNDKKHGVGITRYANGSATKELWENGKCVSITPCCVPVEKIDGAKSSDIRPKISSDEVIEENENTPIERMLDALSEIFKDGVEEIEKTDNFEALIGDLALSLIKADEMGTRATTLAGADKLLKELEVINRAAKRAEILLTKINDDDYIKFKKEISDGSEGK